MMFCVSFFSTAGTSWMDNPFRFTGAFLLLSFDNKKCQTKENRFDNDNKYGHILGWKSSWCGVDTVKSQRFRNILYVKLLVLELPCILLFIEYIFLDPRASFFCHNLYHSWSHLWSLFYLGVMTISNAAVSTLSKKDQRKKLKRETQNAAFKEQQKGIHTNKTKEASLDGGKHRPSPSPGTTNVSMEHRSGKKEHR